MSKSNQPVKVFRDHFLKATIWENDGQNGTFYNVTIARTYKDGDEYKESNSFTGQDIPAAAALLNMAYAEVVALQADRNGGPA